MKRYCPRCNRKYNDNQQRLCLDDGALLSLDLPEYRWLIGHTLDGKYRIDALVGVGGFGAVYSAHHLGLDRQVAYKILQPQVAQRSPEAVGLFEGEAKTAAKLQHENIVAIYDAGRTMDDISYIAMEWLEGRPLDEEMAARGRLGFDRTAEILRQTAAALSFAHARRTVHRDLKPSNVMLIERPDGGEQVKVVDFGIAKVLSSTAASTISRSIGTPAYASPEQWKRGGQIDGRADIYALGVMLFEMLTGKLPFNAQSVEELIRLKLSAPPLSLRFLLPEAPAALDDLLRAMMDIDPNRRPQKVGEVPALFEAACKPLVDLFEAPTLAEATEKMRESEIQRIVGQPRQQPAEAPPPRPPLPEPTPEIAPEPAPRPPEKKLGEPVKPKSEVIKVQPPSSPAPARSTSAKSRAGVIAAVAAALGLLGYGIWTGLPDKQTNNSPPESRQANSFTVELGNNVKLELVNLPGGEFTMGSNDGDSDEKPPHRVKVGPFAIGKYEVTQAQWKALMGDNPSYYKWADDLPVENVSWNMAQDFIKRLNDKLRDGTYRLPTEAEWEYAARAGSQSRYSFGDDASELHNYAWFYDNSDYQMQARQTHPVGRLKPNAFGLFDMHGNVWEWCEDWYRPYPSAEATDPTGPRNGSYRVLRGGSWSFDAVYCRAALRSSWTPGDRSDHLGFRLLRTYR